MIMKTKEWRWKVEKLKNKEIYLRFDLCLYVRRVENFPKKEMKEKIINKKEEEK